MLTIDLTKYEQETIINFNEEEEWADIYTHNLKLMERLDMLAREYPDSCKFVKSRGEECKFYRVDKSLITVRKPYSQARKDRDRARAIAAGRLPPWRQSGNNGSLNDN